MGEIKKVGDTYYIEFYARGLMYSQAAGTSEEEAQKLLFEVESKIAQGEALTLVREIDLDVFFEKFLNYAGTKFTPQSLDRFEKVWKHWRGFLSSTYPDLGRLSQITPSVIETYKTHLLKNTKPKVINLTLLLLREILDYGIRIGFINDNPSIHTHLVKVPQVRGCKSPRSILARDLLKRNLNLERLCALLKLKDVAQIMFWAGDMPVKREDIYNL